MKSPWAGPMAIVAMTGVSVFYSRALSTVATAVATPSHSQSHYNSHRGPITVSFRNHTSAGFSRDEEVAYLQCSGLPILILGGSSAGRLRDIDSNYHLPESLWGQFGVREELVSGALEVFKEKGVFPISFSHHHEYRRYDAQAGQSADVSDHRDTYESVLNAEHTNRHPESTWFSRLFHRLAGRGTRKLSSGGSHIERESSQISPISQRLLKHFWRKASEEKNNFWVNDRGMRKPVIPAKDGGSDNSGEGAEIPTTYYNFGHYLPQFGINDEDERRYNSVYAKSLFGTTRKRCGWDCNRHLEILHNQCVPIFNGIHNVGKHTLWMYPKRVFEKVLEDPRFYSKEAWKVGGMERSAT
jgi:hypothetical protein